MDKLNIGQIISFGSYKWRILDIKNDSVLIITEYIIEQRSYHDVYTDTTWADCSLRKYLNGEFYDQFDEAEKSRIIPVINKNTDNHWYGSKGGIDTEDRVFLLDIEDVVCRYFGDSSEKLYKPGKNQRYWFERKDKNNNNRIALLKDNKKSVWWWWLRSPGRVSVKTVYIHGDGNIGIQGNNILKGNISDGKCTGGVRPALWLKL